MIDAIVFDWGGIFTEGTFDGSAVADLAAATERSPEHIGETYYPLMAQFEVGAFDLDEFHRRFTAGTGTSLSYDAFARTFLGAVRERTAMYAVLGSIPSRYAVGVLSNNVPVLCDRVRSDPRMRRVERWVFSNEIGVRKPDPRAFEALTDTMGVPPERTVFIDDSADNIRACVDLGFRGIHLEDMTGFVASWRALLPDVPTGLDLEP